MDRFDAENKLYHWSALLREDGETYRPIADALYGVAENIRSPPIGRRRTEVYAAADKLDAMGRRDVAEKLRELARDEMRLYR